MLIANNSGDSKQLLLANDFLVADRDLENILIH